jgi:chemotaxis protein MotB
LQEKYDLLANESDQLRQKNEARIADNSELQRTLSEARQEVSVLTQDTTVKFDKMRALQTKYDRLSKQYDYLLDNNNSLIAASARENKTLMDQLSTMQSRLQAKEDSLNTERRMLERGQRRVDELEGIIRRKDSTVAFVRQKVADALLGFNGKGLTVNMRDGKVYVSLENSLLFAPGSWNVAANGQVALENLAKVLADNEDISVLVEGHTDNDPYRGQGQVKDNWDLSVLRATNVVKILTGSSGLSPERITAAGRGEFVPLVANDSPENKAVNRRTEIILTPDLTELANLLEGEK